MATCAFGKVLEQKLINTQTCVSRLEHRFDTFEENLSSQMKELFNHQSSRLPMWATIIITILSSAVVGMIVGVLK